MLPRVASSLGIEHIAGILWQLSRKLNSVKKNNTKETSSYDMLLSLLNHEPVYDLCS